VTQKQGLRRLDPAATGVGPRWKAEESATGQGVPHFVRVLMSRYPPTLPPPGAEIGMIKRWLLRVGTSVGSNYRTALRAESLRDFIQKLGTVEEEAEECTFRLDLLTETGLAAPEEIAPPRPEADELLPIIVMPRETAR